MGALAGLMGSMMALEAIREIVGFGEGLVGRLLLGLGTGGDLDSRVLGGPELTVRQRVKRQD